VWGPSPQCFTQFTLCGTPPRRRAAGAEPMPSIRHAYIDESERDDWFMLTTIVIDAHEQMNARKQLRAARPKGQDRIHFAKMEKEARRSAIAVMGGLPVEALFVRSKVVRGRSIEARVRCMEQTAALLAEEKIVTLTIETCHEESDLADRRVLSEVVKGLDHSGRFHFDHRLPTDEPILWVADGVGWVYGRTERQYRKPVAHLLAATVLVA
jgi:hypothetical protein